MMDQVSTVLTAGSTATKAGFFERIGAAITGNPLRVGGGSLALGAMYLYSDKVMDLYNRLPDDQKDKMEEVVKKTHAAGILDAMSYQNLQDFFLDLIARVKRGGPAKKKK
jgi:hypothetical protein